MGFILLVNGGDDKEAFEFFVAILHKNEGIYRLYEEGFPLYFEYLNLLNSYLLSHSSRLKSHLEEIGFLHAMWF